MERPTASNGFQALIERQAGKDYELLVVVSHVGKGESSGTFSLDEFLGTYPHVLVDFFAIVLLHESPTSFTVAATYIARHYGVHSAMPAVTARRLCPEGICLPPRISYYAEVSSQIQEIFGRFTSLIEPLSLDEAFLDVTGSERLFGPAVEIGRKIKQAVREETQLVVSVGVAPNKFLAKIASDFQKPDGFVVVEPDQIQAFLDPLPVERPWGVGRQGSKVFQRLGIRTVGQLR